MASRSPRGNADSNPLPTDSTVTIRLSDMQTGSLRIQNPSSELENVSKARVTSISSESSACVGSDSNGSTSPTSSTCVDWEELEKTEEQEPRDEGTDESTSLLLARLEQENNALATNPKSGLFKASRRRSQARPPSIQHLKKLVNEPTKPSLRYSQLPTPPMTELEFWAALVADYPQTAQRLPTLTSNKIRGGVPPPLRGVVWPSIAGARDRLLHEEFQKLWGETSPYEGLIGKDIGRSFPNVEMFRDPNGEGQQMLGRVLKCFSLYDQKIGYCQGLGFVVGPLLMHMSDAEAFCVLVRLMEHYDLRSCFLPDLSGLHLRIYQFQQLLARHLPTVSAHLNALRIEPLYVSQWFLSFFAVTCPLPMLLRIYDIILSEGATETLMRVALSLMRRNEKKILAGNEEDVMSLLVSRSLWDTYACHADDLVADFVSLTGLVTRESLQALETSFKEAPDGFSTGIAAAASRLLGRFWAGSHVTCKSVTLSPGNSYGTSRPASFIRRKPSKQSMASTLNSLESTASETSTVPTEASSTSKSSGDASSIKTANTVSPTTQSQDGDLHSQIEDLLMALRDLQREQAVLARDLQKEREEREEDRELARELLSHISGQKSEEASKQTIAKAEERFSSQESRRISILQSKHQLRDDVALWKEKHKVEAARCQDLTRRLDEHDQEHSQLKDELRDARSRLQDGHRDKQRLERTVQDLRARKSPLPESPKDSGISPSSDAGEGRSGAATGLREFKLGRSGSQKATTFSKRTSSLNIQAVLATENHQPAAEDTLLLELVNAKTSEALARQELEEVKGKLESLRKMLGGGASSPSQRIAPIDSCAGLPTLGGSSILTPRTPSESPKATTAMTSGFFSGWGKRSVSNAAPAENR